MSWIRFANFHLSTGERLRHLRDLAACGAAHCTPHTVRACHTRRSDPHGLVSRVDRFGDELHRTIAHCDVSTAGMPTGHRVGSVAPITAMRLTAFTIRRTYRIDAGVHRQPVRPPMSPFPEGGCKGKGDQTGIRRLCCECRQQANGNGKPVSLNRLSIRYPSTVRARSNEKLRLRIELCCCPQSGCEPANPAV